MPQRPYVLLSVAASIDGRIDDTSPDRLLLSNAEDFDRVDQVRAESDAILIGAGTMRADNPRLLVNSEQRRADRLARGLPEYPLKVTVTSSGNLDPDLKFWHHGGAEIVSLGTEIDFGAMLDDLGRSEVQQLMVEGGTQIHTAFLSNNLVDEIHLAIAPIVVGAADAPAFLGPATYPGGSTRRMRLVEARTIGDVVLLRYHPKETSAA
jgi:riboflavin biosynthesis pyrimidine reductase